MKKLFFLAFLFFSVFIYADENNKFLSVSLKDLPPSLNKYKDINPSKKITSYLKDIDFSKLEKALPNMIKVELEKESNTNED